MQGGDISNEVSPRLLVVWENLIGLLPTKADEAKASTYLRFKRYKRAINVFELNEMAAARIWDVTWRMRYSVDVVTWLPEECVDPIQEWIDKYDLPVGHVTNDTPQNLSRRLAYMPQVAAVYSPDDHHQFTFGSKGRIISPMKPNFIGAF